MNEAHASDIAAGANLINGKLSRISRSTWGPNEATALIAVLRILSGVNTELATQQSADFHDPKPDDRPVNPSIERAVQALGELEDAA